MPERFIKKTLVTTHQNETLEKWMSQHYPTLKFSPRDSHANHSPMQEQKKGSTTIEVTYFLKSLKSQEKRNRISYSLKTLRDYYQMITEGHFLESLLSWKDSGTIYNGKLLMENISYPNQGSAFTLSQVLEQNPNPKYFLSRSQTLNIKKRLNINSYLHHTQKQI